MKWKTEVSNAILRILDLVEGEGRAVEALERELERLREENKELRDRFMARSFEEYRTYVHEPAMLEEGNGATFPEDMNEENAGEILEIEDDTS